MEYKATEEALQAHPDLRGIFAINDPAGLGARAALEKAGKTQQVLIVGFDGQPEGKQAIKGGKIYADPIQFPDKMGVQIFEAVVRHSKGEKPKRADAAYSMAWACSSIKVSSVCNTGPALSQTPSSCARPSKRP